MPPPGCPIPEWIYPGRVLRSRQNSNAYVWIDSIRYAETGGFYITLRRVLSFAPMVVDRFCVTEAWALGLFENAYQPTDQWEPHPERSWDETLEREFLDDNHTCEIALRDGTETWNIESLGTAGPRMTMEVSREIHPDVVPESLMDPESYMEAQDREQHQERLARLFDLRGAPPGAFARDMLPHLMLPGAETVPMDVAVVPRALDFAEVRRLHEAGPGVMLNTLAQAPRMSFLPVHNRPGSLRDSLEADIDTFEAGVREMHQAAEGDPDMQVFTSRPLEGFRRLVEAARNGGPMPTGVMAAQVPAEAEAFIREGRYTEVSMGATVPYQLDAPQNNPLWPAWLPYPPNDGQQWHLRVRRMSGGSASILAYPDFQPNDELIWFRDPSMTVQNIGTVQDYSTGRVSIVIYGTTNQVEADPAVLRQIMSHQPARVLGPDLPPAFSIGAAVSLVGGGLIGSVVAITPSGVQVNTHDGFGSVFEFEHGALEPYRGPIPYVVAIGDVIRSPNRGILGHVHQVSGDAVTWLGEDNQYNSGSIVAFREQGAIFERPNLQDRQMPPEAPIRGSIIRAPNGVVIGRVQRVVRTDVVWATSDGRTFTNTEENLREQGGSFEAPNHQTPEAPAERSFIRDANGNVVGRVLGVNGPDSIRVYFTVEVDGSPPGIYHTQPQTLLDDGYTFETPNIWFDPPAHQVLPQQPEKPRPSVYDRILEDDDDS